MPFFKIKSISNETDPANYDSNDSIDDSVLDPTYESEEGSEISNPGNITSSKPRLAKSSMGPEPEESCKESYQVTVISPKPCLSPSSVKNLVGRSSHDT